MENVLNKIEDVKKMEKTVCYTGSLDSKYGIDKLIKAFSLEDLREYELWVYGSGDLEEKNVRTSS